MSSQPNSPGPLPGSSQQQNENNGPPSSSPRSTADSAVHIDETKDRADPDSSFQSNSSERHPKGKRKRTAAKDKAILEAAYNANPKPDKTARLDIVKRVSLNEKEVQIWFQNRRQNDRRKSRPLSPQEIAALQYGGMQVLSSDPAPYSSSQPQISGLTNPKTSPFQQPSIQERPDASPQAVTDHAQPETAAESTAELSETHHNRRESAASMGATVMSSSQPVEFTAGQPHQLYRSASVGYFANRLHAGTSYQANRRSPDSLRHEFLSAAARPSSATPVLPPPLSSGFRLSMSVEGKAELVPQPQPSPPQVSPSPLSDSPPDPFDRPSLHRSRSAAACVTLPPISTLTASLDTNAPNPIIQASVSHQPQPRLSHSLHRSRSRDVHAWEMACEANIEPRDELTAYAARESSGSAIAAISLLRTLSSSSHSGTSHSVGVLQPNGAKRNARPNAQPNHSAKKPKLSRASSSVGRLQTSFVNTTTDKPPVRREQTPVEVDDLKKSKVSILFSPGGNDSDKENWSPDKEGYQMFRGASRPANGRRPLPSEPTSKAMGLQKPRRSVGRVLGDASNSRSLLGRARTAPTSRRRKGSTPVSIFEDGTGGGESESEDENEGEDHSPGAVEDDEVERFMRGEVSPSKKGAASAIAGLLALSQGNWR